MPGPTDTHHATSIFCPRAGVIQLREEQWRQLPDHFSCDVLDLTECTGAIELPQALHVYELRLNGTQIETLPTDLRAELAIHLSNCRELSHLPEGLTTGALWLQGCSSLTRLPEQLDVWFLDMSGCWGFEAWPEHAQIRAGNLNLRGCTAISSLPSYLGPLASLNVRYCSRLSHLPDALKIAGWIDIAQSGLASMRKCPTALSNVEARWQGVRIDRRIWHRPESITIAEILEEQNAELRRVLIDRFGQTRFMAEANAEVLDEDEDAGGTRKLLRVPLREDEPLVTLACRCPSTGRNYFLRVPPNMPSCRHAAAWIAGYDDPDEYRPEIET